MERRDFVITALIIGVFLSLAALAGNDAVTGRAVYGAEPCLGGTECADEARAADPPTQLYTVLWAVGAGLLLVFLLVRHPDEDRLR